MTKLITTITIFFIFLAKCSSQKTNELSARMRQYEQQTKSFNDKANTIESDSLKQKLFSIAMGLFMHERSEINKQIIPNTQYIDNPYFLRESYKSHSDLTDNYINGLTLFYFDNSDTKYTINTSEAFKFPFKINTTWQEAIFDNQKAYPILNNNINIQTNDIQVIESGKWSFPKSFDIKYPTENKTPICTGIKAEIEVEIPSIIHQFHFLKADIGKTQTKNDLSVKLLSMNNNYVEIEVCTPEGFITSENDFNQFKWLEIYAKDNTSKFIHTSSTSTSKHKWTNESILGELYQELTAQETFTSDFLSSFLAKVNTIYKEEEKSTNKKEDKNRQYRLQLFNGVVEEISVDLYDYTTPERILKEVIYPISDVRNLISLGDFKEIKTKGAVYDNEITMLSNKPYDISENELEKQIMISQKPALLSKGAVVKFEYPNSISSKLIGDFDRFSTPKEITFLNKDEKTINISPNAIGYKPLSESDKLVDFSTNRIEYHPKKFSETPYYVKGILTIKIAEIKKQVASVNNLPDGVLIKENAILLDQSKYKSNEYLVLVKDTTNRYLKQIMGYSGAVNINGVNSNKHISYYYGTPQTIEIYKIASSKIVDYKFKIELTREESNEFSLMWN